MDDNKRKALRSTAKTMNDSGLITGMCATTARTPARTKTVSCVMPAGHTGPHRGNFYWWNHDEQTARYACQACGAPGQCTQTDIGYGITAWICDDNPLSKRCHEIAMDEITRHLMTDERLALGYALGRHDAGDRRAVNAGKLDFTDFSGQYGEAMMRCRATKKAFPLTYSEAFESWLKTGTVL